MKDDRIINSPEKLSKNGLLVFLRIADGGRANQVFVQIVDGAPRRKGLVLRQHRIGRKELDQEFLVEYLLFVADQEPSIVDAARDLANIGPPETHGIRKYQIAWVNPTRFFRALRDDLVLGLVNILRVC